MRWIHPLRARTQRAHVENIQGNVLQAYHYKDFPCVAYVWLRFADAQAGRRWLALLKVTPATWPKKPPSTCNVALTAAGLQALDVSKDLRATFSDEFCQGMRKRAEDPIGDLGESAREKWPHPFDGREELHALLTIYAGSPDAVSACVREVPADGVEVVHDQRAGVLPAEPGRDPGREHFGFTDGFSQPVFRGVKYSTPQPKGNGVPLRFGRWRPLALGELVLGYVDEDLVYPEMPGGALGPDSTYMVWRKLGQDVAEFRAWALGAADGDPAAAAKLRAQIVGRWPNGTPLATHPDGSDAQSATDAIRLNAVRYKPDPHGSACPLGAHVRRANPRDGLAFGHKLTFRHRIVRRGMPYGKELGDHPAPTERDEDRGLIFVCFNANISRQYEVVQGEWLSNGRAFDLGPDRDPLTGGPQDLGKFVLHGRPAVKGRPWREGRPATPPTVLAPLPKFVWTQGGEYLWVPSIPALRALGAGIEDRR